MRYVDEMATAHLADLDGTSWRFVGEGCNGWVRDLVVWDDRLWIGGNFTTAGGLRANGLTSWSDDPVLAGEDADIGGGGPILESPHPNPFNPSTNIEFTLPKSEFVELKVYNILGKEVTTLVSNKLNQGNYTYTLDGSNLASGVYYYQLVAGEFKEVKKMILLR